MIQQITWWSWLEKKIVIIHMMIFMQRFSETWKLFQRFLQNKKVEKGCSTSVTTSGIWIFSGILYKWKLDLCYEVFCFTLADWILYKWKLDLYYEVFCFTLAEWNDDVMNKCVLSMNEVQELSFISSFNTCISQTWQAVSHQIRVKFTWLT